MLFRVLSYWNTDVYVLGPQIRNFRKLGIALRECKSAVSILFFLIKHSILWITFVYVSNLRNAVL